MTHPGERRKAATAAMATSPSSSSAGLLRKLNSYPRKVEIGQESKHVSEWVAWCVKTRKTRRAIETLEQLISISEALIIDDDLVEVLRFIARIEPEEDARRLFRELISNKRFTCTTLRPQFERMLEVGDVLRLLDFAIALLTSGRRPSKGAEGGDQFEMACSFQTLELCSCLLDASSHKVVWQKELAPKLNDWLAVLSTMVGVCEEFTKIKAAAETRKRLPQLFAPPRTDYSVKRVRLKRVELS